MGAHNFHDLFAHAGHNVEVVTYGRDGKTVNVAMECTDCNEVLLDFDRFPESEKDAMTWEQKAEWLQSQRYPFRLKALDHKQTRDGTTRWVASILENRWCGESMEDATNKLFDAMLFPKVDEIPLSEYPAWVEELYAGWTVDEWPDEYLKVLIAEMSDDVDCSSSTIVDRATRLSYLADQLPEEVADALDKAALEIVKFTGYASGAQWSTREIK